MITNIMITHIPAIGGMGFPCVNKDELNLIVVLLVEVPKAHGPLHKRGSRETAKYQSNGSFIKELRKANRILTRNIREFEIRCEVTNLRRLWVELSLPCAPFLNALIRFSKFL